MPECHVLGMCPQVCPWLEVMVIEVQIQVMGLKIHEAEDARNSPWKFTETVIDVLRHKCYARLKLIAMHLSAFPHLGRLFLRTGCVGVTWTRGFSH